MQLSFPFQSNSKTDLFGKEDFLQLSENSSAINFLNKFFIQEGFSASQFQSLILRGEKSSGKTHLLHIFAKKFKAEFLDHDKLSGVNPADFFTANQFYILDDINKIKDEELILRLINSAVEAHAFLIISTNSDLKFELKDLSSRLKNIFAVEIKKLSEESLKMLLTHSFARKQIKLSRQVIDFLSDNIQRSFAAVLEAVKLVELQVQESKDGAKIKRIKEIFGK